MPSWLARRIPLGPPQRSEISYSPRRRPIPSVHLTEELKNTLTLVLAGGQGERLKPLTLNRAKPAVPFGGLYRIADFTLSNCIHSGLRRIFLLTQYRAGSLEEHIRFGWNFLPRRLEQFISVQPPHHRSVGKWYEGTADAIYRNIDVIEEQQPKLVLILSGDHIYKMDYGRMIREHLDRGAALTVGAVRIPAEQSRQFGIFQVDAESRIMSFEEKPERGKEIPGEPGVCMGSMGIYVFETGELISRLRADAERGDASTHDFGRDIIPHMVGDGARVYAHGFVDVGNAEEPYWRDVGTIDTYFESNLELCGVAPRFNLYDRKWPIYSLWHADPPAKTVLDEEDGRRAEVVDALLCPGVVVSGAKVRHSVLSNLVYVAEHAEVKDAILFSGVVVGAGAKIQRTIVDKWVKIPPEARIGYDPEEDARRFTVTSSGNVVVPRGYEF